METIEGRSETDEVIRINRTNDPHTISDKIFDFSNGTIEGLPQEGHYNAKMKRKNKSRAELEKIR
jgi:NTE family protein